MNNISNYKFFLKTSVLLMNFFLIFQADAMEEDEGAQSTTKVPCIKGAYENSFFLDPTYLEKGNRKPKGYTKIRDGFSKNLENWKDKDIEINKKLDSMTKSPVYKKICFSKNYQAIWDLRRAEEKKEKEERAKEKLRYKIYPSFEEICYDSSFGPQEFYQRSFIYKEQETHFKCPFTYEDEYFQLDLERAEACLKKEIISSIPIIREKPLRTRTWEPGVSGYVFNLNSEIIVAFTGTRPRPEDTWMDINARMSYAPELDGVFHYGFLKRSRELYKSVDNALSTIAAEKNCDVSDLPLTFIGHSSGSSVAAILNLRHFRKYNVKSLTYLYGGPAFLDVPTARAYDKDLKDYTLDIRLTNDFIPGLNPFCLTSARHVGRLLEIPPPPREDHTKIQTPFSSFVSRHDHIPDRYKKALYAQLTGNLDTMISDREDERHWNPLQRMVGRISKRAHRVHRYFGTSS